MSISIEKLSYTYMKGGPFEKEALKDINLSIESGEFVGIIGHTGSGKSTLVQQMNGLLKPTSGRVILNGMDVTGKNLKELRKQVGIVFQYPEHQLFEETVYKDIAFGLTKSGMSPEETDAEIRKAIKVVGLPEEVLLKSPFELSGGQKRRVAIAGVIVMNPKILILDEPTAGLDPAGRDEIFAFISRLHKDLGLTIILVSHSMEDVARLVKRVIVINKGTIAMDGSTREVFKRGKELEGMGLSVPQVTYLLQRLAAAVPGFKSEAITVGEAKRDILEFIKRAK